MQATVFLGYQSALEHLCRERYFSQSSLDDAFVIGEDAPAPTQRTERVASLPEGTPPDRLVAELLDRELRGLSRPVHVLVPQRVFCDRSPVKVAHLWSGPAIRGSFARISPELYVPSPELCLVQMARLLKPLELVRLAYELCGTYALAPCPGDAFRTCLPATSVEHLRAFALRARSAGIRGAGTVLRLLGFVADHAASPMESITTLLLCLPYRLGGYGLPLPVLNQAPALAGNTRALSGRDGHRCDLFWPMAGVAVEYEGEESHTGLERIERDSQRDNAMASQSVRVMRITKKQLYDTGAFDLVARQLMRLLRKRPHMQECSYNWALRRSDLHWQLLPGKNNPHCNERAGRGNPQ